MSGSNQAPAVHVEMLIRSPAQDVFAAFVEPDLLAKFWLARSSGPLVAGGKVRWEFMVEGAAADVDVKAVEKNKRLLIAWPDRSTVEWTFTERAKDETVVAISHKGFTGDLGKMVAEALDSAQGFTIVLCELKALLERGMSLNLVKDKAVLIESAGGRSAT